MRTLFAVVLCSLLALAVGCKSDDNGMNNGSKDKMAMDACPHCPGVQHLTADGKCENCKMKMSDAATPAQKMAAKTTTDVDTKAHSAAGSVDACAHCAGSQTATADGKCPVCGMKVATAVKEGGQK
jgi:hypothetical protein